MRAGTTAIAIAMAIATGDVVAAPPRSIDRAMPITDTDAEAQEFQWTAPSTTGRMRAEQGDPRIPVPDDSDHVRVASWNVWKGADVDGLAAAIRQNPALTQAQIILLQEIEDHPGEPGSRAARLAHALGMGFVYAPERPAGQGTHGHAILSRWPLENVQVMGLPIAPIYNPPEQRFAVAADVHIGRHVLRVVTVHLDTRLSHDVRTAQLAPALRDAPPLTIVGGDFNTLPLVSPAQRLDGFMRAQGYATPTSAIPWTHVYAFDRRWLVNLAVGYRSRLDGIYLRGLTARGQGCEHRIALSDHRPIWVDVVLPR